MIKAIIFDYDGVIVDSFGSVFEVYKIICQRFGVVCPETLEDFRHIYGYNYMECFINLGIKEENFTEAKEIYKNEISQMEHGLFLGIAEVIRELSVNYKIYLVSASHSDEILPKIKKFNLTHYFEKIYCCADYGVRKSEMFIDLIRKNNYLPEELISIGDRAIDYEVAQRADIPDSNVILVTYGWGLDKSKIGKVNIC